MSMTVANPALRAAPPRQHLSETEKSEIIAERFGGMLVRDIALKHGINEVTVWRTCKVAHDTSVKLAKEWRQEQATMAVESVNRALVDDTDNYKSAGIAVQALKGLGVYAQEQQVFNIAQVIDAAPASMRDLLEATPTAGSGAIDVEPTE